MRSWEMSSSKIFVPFLKSSWEASAIEHLLPFFHSFLCKSLQFKYLLFLVFLHTSPFSETKGGVQEGNRNSSSKNTWRKWIKIKLREWKKWPKVQDPHKMIRKNSWRKLRKPWSKKSVPIKAMIHISASPSAAGLPVSRPKRRGLPVSRPRRRGDGNAWGYRIFPGNK